VTLPLSPGDHALSSISSACGSECKSPIATYIGFGVSIRCACTVSIRQATPADVAGLASHDLLERGRRKPLLLDQSEVKVNKRFELVKSAVLRRSVGFPLGVVHRLFYLSRVMKGGVIIGRGTRKRRRRHGSQI
jgi:hypothetical protein